MSLLSDWLKQEVPIQLYHYTKKDSFLSILESSALWATHILYQNDAKEFNLTFELLEEVLKDTSLQAVQQLHDWKINTDSLIKSIKYFLNKSIFTISLSECPDLLSQWRGYAKSTPSFCIGFQSFYLKKCIKYRNITLAKCIYDYPKQLNFIKEFVYDSVNTAIKHDERLIAQNMSSEIVNYASIIKHSDFKEEHEWRIIIHNKNKINIRVGESFFLPYYIFKICKDMIGDVIIGPCSDKNTVYNSTLFACHIHGIDFNGTTAKDKRELKHSGIPYRNW